MNGREQLDALLDATDGAITTEQFAAAGLSGKLLRELLACRELYRIRQGVYVRSCPGRVACHRHCHWVC